MYNLQVYWYNASNQSTTKPQRQHFKNFIKSHIYHQSKINIKYITPNQHKSHKKPDIIIIKDKSREYWYRLKDISKKINLKSDVPQRFLTVYSPTPSNFLKKDTMFISENGVKYMARRTSDSKESQER